MMQRPIALDEISLNAPAYFVPEGAGEVLVELRRVGRLLDTTSVLLRTRTLFIDNAAEDGIDFSEVSEVVTFEPGQPVAIVTIPLSPDDVFPEPDKVFEVFLGPTDGVYITPYAAANVTILNDDDDLPVLEVSIGELFPVAREGQGVLEVTVVKSEGAVGPVRVRLFTQDDTATSGFDYVPIDIILTFSIEETIKTEQIIILDDSVFEDLEFFVVSVEAINEEGDFPVVTVDSNVAIAIEDTDVVVIGYNPAPCRTNEGAEALIVFVDILYGELARNLSIQFDTFSVTALDGEDFLSVSQSLSFSSSRRRNTVFVPIIDDPMVEETESFNVRLLLSGSDSELGTISIAQSVAQVFIEDDDSILITLILTPRVPEGGVATATVGVLDGQLGSEVRVRLNTISGNATADVDFQSLVNFELVLDQTNMVQSVDIPVFDNIEFGGNKVFSVVAELVSFGERVRIDPTVAMTTIVENELAPQVQCYLFDRTCREGNSFQLDSMRDCCVFLQAQSFSFSDSTLCYSCILIGFNRSEFVLLERNESYSLRVDVRTGFLPQDIALELVVVPGTASPEDYLVPQLITLTVEQPFANVPITLPQELVNTDDDFEEFRINIVDVFGTAPSNMFFTGTVVNIRDFEPVVEFAQTIYTAFSEEEVISVSIMATPPPQSPILVELRLVSGSATAGVDAELRDPQVLLEPGASSVSAEIAIISDGLLEDFIERFFVEIVSVSDGEIGQRFNATVIIFDQDSVNIIVDGVSGMEGGVATLEVTRVGGAEIPVVLSLEYSGFVPAATPFEDFDASTNSITIDPGQSTATLLIPLPDDDISEAREAFLVVVTPLENRVATPDEDLTLFIEDNDVAMVVFAESAYTASEADNSVTVGVALSPGTVLDPNLSIGVRIRAIQFGEVTVAVEEVLLTSAEPSAEVSITTLNDEITEADKEFELVASAALELTFDPPQLVDYASATVTVFEDDVATVGFNQSLYFVGEPTESVTAVVEVLSGFLAVPTTLTVSTVSVTAVGDGVDYLDIFETISVSSEESALVTISIIDDGLVERPETFQLSLQLGDGGEGAPIILQPATADVTIASDDLAVIGFSQESYSTAEGDGVLNVTVSVRSGTLGLDLLVFVQPTGSEEDTATADEDYVLSRTSVLLNSEITEATVSILITDDPEVEDAEFFTIAVDLGERNQPVNIEFGPRTALITILDNEEPFQVGFQTTAVSGDEFSEVFLLFLNASGPFPDAPVTVQVTFINGTAEAGRDIFESGVRNVEIDPESQEGILLVGINSDGLYEADEESLTVRIISVSTGTIDPARQDATVTIIDRDQIFVGANIGRVSEGSGEVAIEFFIEGFIAIPVNLTIILERPSEASPPALPGEDYIPLADNVFQFLPETSTFRQVSLEIVDDERTEEREEFVQFSVNFTMSRISSEGPRVFAIEDDDSATIGYRPSLYSVSEAGGVVEISFEVLNGVLGVNYTVNVFSLVEEDGGAQPGTDFVPVARLSLFTLNFEIRQASFNVTIIDDEEPEGAELFMLSLSQFGESSANVTIAPSTAQVIIEDDDQFAQLQVGFMNSSVRVNEFDEATLILGVLEGVNEVPVTVNLEYISGTADVQSDIFEPQTSVTIEPGSGEAEVIILPTVDERYEADQESLTVRIVSVTGGNIDEERQEAIVTILDNDELILNVGAFEQPESSQEPVSFTVNIESGISDVPVQLSVRTEFLGLDEGTVGQATPVEDYIPVDLEEVIEPGTGELTITLDQFAVDDNLTEGPEFIFFNITTSMPRIILFVSGTFSIVDDDTTVIGFNPDNYVIREGFELEPAVLSVSVEILNGTLARGVTYPVQVATEDLTDQPNVAIAGVDYGSVSTTLEFSSDVERSQLAVLIEILSDQDIEEPEQFLIRLTPIEDFPLLVELSPSLATVTIRDGTPQ
jgi:hypothetical protein